MRTLSKHAAELGMMRCQMTVRPEQQRCDAGQGTAHWLNQVVALRRSWRRGARWRTWWPAAGAPTRPRSPASRASCSRCGRSQCMPQHMQGCWHGCQCVEA